MIKTESIEKTVKSEKILEISCDSPECKSCERYYPRKGIWNDYDDDHEFTKVSANLIINGGYQEYDFDVCPTCFVNKIVPMFNGKGIEDRIKHIQRKIQGMIDNAESQLKITEEEHKKSVDRGDLLSMKYVNDMHIIHGKIAAYRMLLSVIAQTV